MRDATDAKAPVRDQLNEMGVAANALRKVDARKGDSTTARRTGGGR